MIGYISNQQLYLSKDPRHKLPVKYYGPCKIIEHIGQVAYKLLLPEGSEVRSYCSCFIAQEAAQESHKLEGVIASDNMKEKIFFGFLADKAVFQVGRKMLSNGQDCSAVFWIYC